MPSKNISLLYFLLFMSSADELSNEKVDYWQSKLNDEFNAGDFSKISI